MKGTEGISKVAIRGGVVCGDLVSSGDHKARG